MSPLNPAFHNPAPEVLFSMNALRRAWQMVRRNGQSPGTDGLTVQQFEANSEIELNRLRQQILGGTYQPMPVRRFYIQKSSGKQRPVTIWALRDRLVQRVVHDYLTPVLEGLFLDCSYGFRPGRSVEQAVQTVIQARNRSLLWVLDADISDCFSSIPLESLVGQLRRVIATDSVLKLVDQWLHTPVEKARNELAGLSQGGVISPQLANLYLHRFDEMITAALPQTALVRFADDFVILCRSEAETVWSLDVARRSLENLRLALNMRKTRIVHFDEGFKFLGVMFKGQRYTAASNTLDEED